MADSETDAYVALYEIHGVADPPDVVRGAMAASADAIAERQERWGQAFERVFRSGNVTIGFDPAGDDAVVIVSMPTEDLIYPARIVAPTSRPGLVPPATGA